MIKKVIPFMILLVFSSFASIYSQSDILKNMYLYENATGNANMFGYDCSEVTAPDKFTLITPDGRQFRICKNSNWIRIYERVNEDWVVRDYNFAGNMIILLDRARICGINDNLGYGCYIYNPKYSFPVASIPSITYGVDDYTSSLQIKFLRHNWFIASLGASYTHTSYGTWGTATEIMKDNIECTFAINSGFKVLGCLKNGSAGVNKITTNIQEMHYYTSLGYSFIKENSTWYKCPNDAITVDYDFVNNQGSINVDYSQCEITTYEYTYKNVFDFGNVIYITNNQNVLVYTNLIPIQIKAVEMSQRCGIQNYVDAVFSVSYDFGGNNIKDVLETHSTLKTGNVTYTGYYMNSIGDTERNSFAWAYKQFPFGSGIGYKFAGGVNDSNKTVIPWAENSMNRLTKRMAQKIYLSPGWIVTDGKFHYDYCKNSEIPPLNDYTYQYFTFVYPIQKPNTTSANINIYWLIDDRQLLLPGADVFAFYVFGHNETHFKCIAQFYNHSMDWWLYYGEDYGTSVKDCAQKIWNYIDSNNLSYNDVTYNLLEKLTTSQYDPNDFHPVSWSGDLVKAGVFAAYAINSPYTVDYYSEGILGFGSYDYCQNEQYKHLLAFDFIPVINVTYSYTEGQAIQDYVTNNGNTTVCLQSYPSDFKFVGWEPFGGNNTCVTFVATPNQNTLFARFEKDIHSGKVPVKIILKDLSNTPIVGATLSNSEYAIATTTNENGEATIEMPLHTCIDLTITTTGASFTRKVCTSDAYNSEGFGDLGVCSGEYQYTFKLFTSGEHQVRVTCACGDFNVPCKLYIKDFDLIYNIEKDGSIINLPLVDVYYSASCEYSNETVEGYISSEDTTKLIRFSNCDLSRIFKEQQGIFSSLYATIDRVIPIPFLSLLIIGAVFTIASFKTANHFIGAGAGLVAAITLFAIGWLPLWIMILIVIGMMLLFSRDIIQFMGG